MTHEEQRRTSRNQPKILVSVGTGGVGKTTISTVLALRMARSGLKTLVLTVDPARRLKGLLGLEGVGVEYRVVLSDEFPGELWASVLDVEYTLEAAVRKTGTPEQVEAVLNHGIYRMLVASLSGMQELMALEYLDQAIDRGYQAVVIDTAPSRHAFEFLDKPEFFAELVALPLVKIVGRTYRFWAASPIGRLGLSSLNLYAKLEELVGAGLVHQILDFYGLFRSIAEGYAERARRTAQMLRNPERAGFVIVTVPGKAERDLEFFERELKQRAYPLDSVVLNRCWPEPPKDLSPRTEEEEQLLSWGRAIAEEQKRVLARLVAAGREPMPVLELAKPVDGIGALEKLLHQFGNS